jgi:membrane carboxypeptidase/penicillin-binding protein PbpC
MLLDICTSFVTHEGDAYTPVNYDAVEHGPVLVREALASSLNIPAVLTLKEIGLTALFKTASAMGITTFGDPAGYDLSLALGGGDVTLLELTAAYGVFANGGVRVPPVAILEVTGQDSDQALYRSPAPAGTRVLDERVAWLISDILSDDDARVTGFGRNSVLRLDRPAAVKTGTTTDFHDNWTIGYTPGLVVGVWAGNASHEAMRNITGLTGAAPIWHQFIRTVLEGTPIEAFTRPPGLVRTDVCALSGLLPTPNCPLHRMEWFIEGTQPSLPDTIYRQVTIDTATGQLADASTPPERQATRTVLDLPPRAQPWAHAQHLVLLSDLLQTGGEKGSIIPNDYAQATPESCSSSPLSLVSPADRSTYKIAAGPDPASQSLHLLAVAEPGVGPVTLYVDGVPLATLSSPPYEAWWPLSPGEHIAWAQSNLPTGELVSSPTIHFTVR